MAAVWFRRLVLAAFIVLAFVPASAFAATMDYLGPWSSSTTYTTGKVVKHNGGIFYSLKSTNSAPNRNKMPSGNPTWWEPVGTVGSALRSGLQAPSPSIGNPGDYYIDTANNRLFGPKAAVTGWPASAVSLIGPAGPTGATGAQGTQGPAGAQGAAGATGPAGATGAVGAQGTPGAKGDKGDKGDAGPYPTGMMVVDATGAVVGSWMGDTVLMKLDGEFFLVALKEFGFDALGVAYYHTTEDCSGAAYIEAEMNPQLARDARFVQDGNTVIGGKGTIIIPTGPIIQLSILSATTFGEFGPACEAMGGYERDVIAPKSISVDFQTPFSLN